MWGAALLLTALLAACARAQIPSLGWCPDYKPMDKFDMNRFLGQWHEAERYFTVTEVGSRCVTTNYEKMSDGRVWVSNEIRNSFTGVKRVVEGQLQVIGRDGEGRIAVKYTSLPVPYEAQYVILDTDYTNWAVMWSCNGIGPIHAQSAWVMTRERLAPGLVLQRAYGVLDKYKISRAFFVRTNQDDCTIQPNPIEAVDPTPDPSDEEQKNVVAAVKNAVEVPVKVDESKDKRESQPAPVPVPAPPAPAVKAVLPVPELIKASAAAEEAPQKVSAEENKVQEEPKVAVKAAANPEKPQEQPEANREAPAAVKAVVPVVPDKEHEKREKVVEKLKVVEEVPAAAAVAKSAGIEEKVGEKEPAAPKPVEHVEHHNKEEHVAPAEKH